MNILQFKSTDQLHTTSAQTTCNAATTNIHILSRLQNSKIFVKKILLLYKTLLLRNVVFKTVNKTLFIDNTFQHWITIKKVAPARLIEVSLNKLAEAP